MYQMVLAGMAQSISCLQGLWTDSQTDIQTDGRPGRQAPAPYEDTSRQVGRIKTIEPWRQQVTGAKLLWW